MKLKFNSKIPKALLYVLIMIIVIIVFFYIMINADIKYLIIDSVNYNYDDRKIYINDKSKSEYIYLSLNKVAKFNKTISLEDELTEDISSGVKTPLVYIYNTHQTEGYNYDNLDYTIKPTVLFASYILKDFLNDYGIESIVETSSMKNYLTDHNIQYSHSYEASRNYLSIAKEKYPTLKYFIDLHRDSSKISKTLYEKNNIRYAKIMFVVGMNYKNSNLNLEYANQLNKLLTNEYKGISRGIYKKEKSRFNQDISDKCILLELGGVDNTLEEINNSLEVFSKVLSKYIGDNNGS